jgi:hypothetical protein
VRDGPADDLDLGTTSIARTDRIVRQAVHRHVWALLTHQSGGQEPEARLPGDRGRSQLNWLMVVTSFGAGLTGAILVLDWLLLANLAKFPGPEPTSALVAVLLSALVVLVMWLHARQAYGRAALVAGGRLP